MSAWLRAVLAAAGIAVVAVVALAYLDSQNEAGWNTLASARASGLTIESLETAREQARGTSAEPWAAYHLAHKLFQRAEENDFERARQVAQASVDSHPEHYTSKPLRALLDALETYSP